MGTGRTLFNPRAHSDLEMPQICEVVPVADAERDPDRPSTIRQLASHQADWTIRRLGSGPRSDHGLEKGHLHFRVQLQIGPIVGTLGRSANPIRVSTGLR